MITNILTEHQLAVGIQDWRIEVQVSQLDGPIDGKLLDELEWECAKTIAKAYFGFYPYFGMGTLTDIAFEILTNGKAEFDWIDKLHRCHRCVPSPHQPSLF